MERQIILDENTYTIKAGQEVKIRFRAEIPEGELRRNSFRLQLRGRVGIHPSLMYEGGLPLLFRDIDDSLSTETHHSRFSLKITSSGEDWPRRAYCRIDCPPWINSQYAVPESGDTVWKFHGLVRTQDFTVEEGGKAQIVFETYRKKAGRDVRDISGEADETTVIFLPAGTADWTDISGEITIDSGAAAVLVSICTEKTRGTVWIEDLSLMNDTGFNILPPFDLTNRYHPFMNWLGENLSGKEWTSMDVELNGQRLGTHRLFQRCFAGAENEIRIPDGALREGGNELVLTNVSDYLCPAPYILSRLALIVEKRCPAELVFCPEYVSAGEEFGILVRICEPETEAEIRLPAELTAAAEAEDSCGQTAGSAPGTSGVPGVVRMNFMEAGLHVIRLRAGETGSHLKVEISARGELSAAEIIRIVRREPDGVITGSGDAVYIPQEMEDMEDFLCWYLSGHLGNMITFRPVYRWCGSRTCHPDVWKRMAELLNGLNISYCYISDGRELPGINANPSDEMLRGKYYLGSQGHERDGAFYYWLQTARYVNETLYEQICRKVCRHPDYTYRTPFEYGPDDVYYNFSPVKCKGMDDGAGQFVEKMSRSLKGIRRHTGPSTLFKYIYQAGVEVCGAELMYGPTEVILSALRGAGVAYDRDVFTAHLAVQWGTTPHDSAAHFRRYRLALYISYMHGCSHINTEEGFYRMEELFAESDRFSLSCTGHADVQREFFRFVQTHSRTGRMVSPVALLHGANDAWVCFTRRNAWSQEGDKWKFDTPEESWDLIRVFYPDSVLDAIYRHPCPDAPQGYYTRTPYGTVDILPVEASVEKYRRYSHMAFLGYNTAEENQVDKLCEYVRGGGKLLLGWCHLCTDTDRDDAIRGIPHLIDAERLTGVKLKRFLPGKDGVSVGEIVPAGESSPECGIFWKKQSAECGNGSAYGENTEVLREKEGHPLLIRRRLGRGEVYLVNVREYPAAAGACELYEEVLTRFAREAAELQMEKGWLTGNDTVGSAVYDREDGSRVIYAVNTDWWSTPARTAYAQVHLAGKTYTLPVERDRITQITIRGDVAAVTDGMETEILDVIRGKTGAG